MFREAAGILPFAAKKSSGRAGLRPRCPDGASWLVKYPLQLRGRLRINSRKIRETPSCGILLMGTR